MKRKTTKPQNAEEIKAAEDMEGLKREKIPDLYSFFSTGLGDTEAYEIKLYRVEVSKNGQKKKKYLDSFYNTVPKEFDIGMEYGSGDYWAVAPDPLEQGATLEIYFSIDPIFDERRRRAQYGNQGPGQAPGIDPWEQAGRVIKLIEPFIKMAQGGGNGAAGASLGNMGRIFENMAEGFTKGMSKMQNALVQQKIDYMNEPPEIEVPEPDNNIQWAREIIDFAKPFLERVINANGIESKAYETILKADPRFKAAQQDEEKYSAIYTLGCEDPEIGPGKMNALFQKLGFEVPEEEPAE